MNMYHISIEKIFSYAKKKTYHGAFLFCIIFRFEIKKKKSSTNKAGEFQAHTYLKSYFFFAEL
jgi:hypothetical protein